MHISFRVLLKSVEPLRIHFAGSISRHSEAPVTGYPCVLRMRYLEGQPVSVHEVQLNRQNSDRHSHGIDLCASSAWKEDFLRPSMVIDLIREGGCDHVRTGVLK